MRTDNAVTVPTRTAEMPKHRRKNEALLEPRPKPTRRSGKASLRPLAAGIRTWALASILMMSVAVTACGGDDDADPVLPAPPSLSAPSPAQQPPKEAALAAYRGMWAAYAKAGETADPDHPDLRKYAADKALTALTDALKGFQAKGQVTKGSPELSPLVVNQSPAANGAPETVEIRDCVDTSEWLIYTRAGGKVDDEPGGRRSVGATVTHIEAGVWKVTLFGVRDVGTC